MNKIYLCESCESSTGQIHVKNFVLHKFLLRHTCKLQCIKCQTHKQNSHKLIKRPILTDLHMFVMCIKSVAFLLYNRKYLQGHNIPTQQSSHHVKGESSLSALLCPLVMAVQALCTIKSGSRLSIGKHLVRILDLLSTGRKLTDIRVALRPCSLWSTASLSDTSSASCCSQCFTCRCMW